jgi:hypothetical protein
MMIGSKLAHYEITGHLHRWQIAPDGTFLLQTFPEQPFATPITIIANWPALLKKK